MNPVIVYLSRSNERDIKNLKRSLNFLDVNFNNQFNYPVVIFHEDFDSDLIKKIRKNTRSCIKFIKVKFELPDFLSKKEIDECIKNKIDNWHFLMGYRHMCRFFCRSFFDILADNNYDWYWRLDTDSFLLSKINYDIFLFMEKNKYLYGYMVRLTECEEAAKDLSNHTNKFIKNNKIKPKFLSEYTRNGKWDRSYYYTNFEISRIDFWRSPEYIKYFDYLDRTGGIYKYRWGDAAIHFIALSMFVEKQQIHQFNDVAYWHRVFLNIPNSYKKGEPLFWEFYVRVLLIKAGIIFSKYRHIIIKKIAKVKL